MKNNIDHITTTASNILKMQNNNLSSLIRKSLLMVLFGLLFIGNASASHLVGGDISYEHIGEGIYKIDLRIYYDGNSAVNVNFDDPATINMLEIASLNNTLSQVMIMNAYSTGKLSNPTFVAMLEKVDAQRSEDHTEAMKYVRAMLVPEVLPGTILSGADDSHKKAAKKVAEIEAALILEVRRNPGVNRLEFIKPLVTARLTVDERDNTKAIEKAEKQMQKLREQNVLPNGFTVEDAINYYTSKGQKKMVENLKVLQQ